MRTILAIVCAAVLLGLSSTAFAQNKTKLNLDYKAGTTQTQTQQQPLYKPQGLTGGQPGPKLPDTRPTVVTGTDSKGNRVKGVGVQTKF